MTQEPNNTPSQPNVPASDEATQVQPATPVEQSAPVEPAAPVTQLQPAKPVEPSTSAQPLNTNSTEPAQTQVGELDATESSENGGGKEPQPATMGRKAIWVIGALVAVYFIGDGIIGLITK